MHYVLEYVGFTTKTNFKSLSPLSETQESGGIYVFVLSCYVLDEVSATLSHMHPSVQQPSNSLGKKDI